MSRNPANRTVAGHVKEGLKNIPKTYQGLYNRPGPMGGAKTVPQNVKLIATGKTSSALNNKISAGNRAKLAALGAASVTPAGPVAAFAMGVNKSVKDKAAAKANAAAPKPAAAPPPKLKIKATAATPPKAPPAPAKRGVVPAAPPKPGAPKIGGSRTPPAAPKPRA